MKQNAGGEDFPRTAIHPPEQLAPVPAFRIDVIHDQHVISGRKLQSCGFFAPGLRTAHVNRRLAVHENTSRILCAENDFDASRLIEPKLAGPTGIELAVRLRAAQRWPAVDAREVDRRLDAR